MSVIFLSAVMRLFDFFMSRQKPVEKCLEKREKTENVYLQWIFRGNVGTKDWAKRDQDLNNA